jgi:hypothetical protein
MERDVLEAFQDRMLRLGINVELVGNYPWVYIESINGKRVTETFRANHGFTIAFTPIRLGQKLEITDISEVMNLVRKYTNKETRLLTVD